MKVLKWLDDHFEEVLLVILLVLISVVSLLQVVFKKMPGLTPLTWSDEFARYMWIWTVFLSLPYTIRKGSMLRVSILMDLLPQGLHKIINILVDLVNAACMAILGYFCIDVVGNVLASGETSTAMVWPMWIVYSVMLIGYWLGCFRAIQMAVIHIMHFNERELTTIEQTIQDAADEAAMAKGEKGGNE